MKSNNFGYLLKEGVKGIFLHGFMSFAAVCVTVACLLIVGSFTTVAYNLNIMVEELNKTNEVTVYVDRNLSDAEAKSIDTKIKRLDNIASCEFVYREDAFEDFKNASDNPDAFDGFDTSYLEHRYIVILEDNRLMQETIDQLMQIPGIVDYRAAQELADGFSAMQDILRVVTVVVTIVLLIVSLLIISNTVKLAMYDRRDEISIMKMVGATNGFIRLPFVVEGFLLGMTGAALAFLVEWLAYDAVVDRIAQADALDMFQFVPFDQIVWPLVGTFAAAGLFVGIVGSWTSIRKFMDV